MGGQVVGRQPAGEPGGAEKNEVVRARSVHLRNSLREEIAARKWNGRRRRPVSDHDARCTCTSPTVAVYIRQAEVKQWIWSLTLFFLLIARFPKSEDSSATAKRRP